MRRAQSRNSDFFLFIIKIEMISISSMYNVFTPDLVHMVKMCLKPSMFAKTGNFDYP